MATGQGDNRAPPWQTEIKAQSQSQSQSQSKKHFEKCSLSPDLSAADTVHPTQLYDYTGSKRGQRIMGLRC